MVDKNPIEGLMLGDIVEGIIVNGILEPILHDIRPDILFAEDFPEIVKAVRSAEPGNVIKSIVEEMRR